MSNSKFSRGLKFLFLYHVQEQLKLHKYYLAIHIYVVVYRIQPKFGISIKVYEL